MVQADRRTRGPAGAPPVGEGAADLRRMLAQAPPKALFEVVAGSLAQHQCVGASRRRLRALRVAAAYASKAWVRLVEP